MCGTVIHDFAFEIALPLRGQLAPQSLVVQSVGVLIGSPTFIAGKLPVAETSNG